MKLIFLKDAINDVMIILVHVVSSFAIRCGLWLYLMTVRACATYLLMTMFHSM